MGRLVAMHYRISFTSADHTYVECGTGAKGWGCLGRKSGGSALTAGAGSTRHAETTAEPDERAGITQYLVNGVCHQAANRVLSSANIIVDQARGYFLSESIYGTYGRPNALGFSAPFKRHAGVTGDLPDCAGPAFVAASDEQSLDSARKEPDERLKRYLLAVSEVYSRLEEKPLALHALPTEDLIDFHSALFSLQLQFRVGDLDENRNRYVQGIRSDSEKQRLDIESAFSHGHLKPREFVGQFERWSADFQSKIAEALSASDYRRLWDLERGEAITLVDWSIANDVYPN